MKFKTGDKVIMVNFLQKRGDKLKEIPFKDLTPMYREHFKNKTVFTIRQLITNDLFPIQLEEFQSAYFNEGELEFAKVTSWRNELK